MGGREGLFLEHPSMMTEEGLAHCMQFNVGKSADQAEKEIEFNATCYRFSAALIALQNALKVVDHAQGSTSLVDGRYTPEQARTLQCRWDAAAIVMREAVAGLAKDGNVLIDTIRALLVP